MIASDLMGADIYSIRMHASREDRHLSGAERLVTSDRLERAAAEFVRRALTHECGCAESIRLSIDRVDPAAVRQGRLPDVRTLKASDFSAGREAAVELLQKAGVRNSAAWAAIEHLSAGAAPGCVNMRGAMLIGSRSGQRYEPDPARGVRASRMDLTSAARERLTAALRRHSLDHPRVIDALVLAAKVMAGPGIAAELCWSDDPNYITGYVAAPNLGYVRIDPLKPRGEALGGRAFFVAEEDWNRDRLIDYLQKDVFLADDIGRIFPTGEGF